jgi:hypothetical protein
VILVSIVSNTKPTILNDFNFVPNTTPILDHFVYTLDLSQIVKTSFDYTVKPELKDEPAIPSWLSFNTTNNTFYGTPTLADFTSPVTFPIVCYIKLVIIDIYGNK